MTAMTFSIQLENNVWTYCPGQIIKGKVVVERGIWNKVEGLTLRLYGKLQVGRKAEGIIGPPIEELAGIGSGGRGDCMSSILKKVGDGEEVLLDHSINLLDSWKVLKPGKHEFSFMYALPKTKLPPSFKIKGARVHYEFVTTLKNPRDDFKIYQTPFNIAIQHEEYSEEDFGQFWLPAMKSEERRIRQWMGCCLLGTANLDVEVSQRIFSIGGSISFMVKTRNNLRTSLEPVQAALVRKFKCKKHSRASIKEVIASAKGPGPVPPGELQLWNASLQIVQKIPPTTTQQNKFYKIQHVLKFKVYPLKHRSQGLSLKFPVVLLPPQVFEESTTPRPTAPVRTGSEASTASSPPQSPPPSYEFTFRPPFVQDDQRASTSHVVSSDHSKRVGV